MSPRRNNVVLYTAIFGRKDKLRISSSSFPGIKCIVFSDDPELKSSEGVDVQYCLGPYDDPVRNARQYKILPQKFLADYEYSIWVDGNIYVVNPDLIDLLFDSLFSHDLACFRHPNRDCVYQEIDACIRLGKDDPSLLSVQSDYYRQQGLPEHIGLIHSAVLFRRHTANMARFGELWWEQIERFSRRDQVSFSYVAWKLGFSHALIHGNLHGVNNRGFIRGLHAITSNWQPQNQVVVSGSLLEKLLNSNNMDKVLSPPALNESLDVLLAQAERLYKEGSPGDAAKLLRLGTLVTPKRTTLWRRLWLAEMRAGHMFQAALAAKQWLDLVPADHPRMPDAQAVLDKSRIDAESRLVLGRSSDNFDEIQTVLHELLQLGYPHPEQSALQALVTQRIQLKKLAEKLSGKQLMDTDLDSGWHFLHLARRLQDRGAEKMALESLRQLNVVDAGNEFALGMLCLQEADVVEAEAAFARGLLVQRAGVSPTRVVVIQHLVERKRAKRYLEIGVSGGHNLLSIECPEKIAVDPAFRVPVPYPDQCRGKIAWFQMTSDAYFSHREQSAGYFDLVFIDGLHTFEQSLKDLENALECLAPGGVIVLHDCLPATATEQHPERARAALMPDYTGAWTGDVWKTLLYVRSNRTDLSVVVIDADHGIGLVVRKPSSILPPGRLDLQSVAGLGWEDFLMFRQVGMNVVPAGEWQTAIEFLLT